jgi:pyruvate dehydrogenase E2 component (dihydrolipoamide acetyltransferase)
MVTEVRLPQWGMGMQEGTVVRWLKRVGDEVEAGEPIAEVEAAKTTEELTAPVDGVLERVLVSEGETVPVQELLAVIAAPGGAADHGHADDGVDGAAAGTEPPPAAPRTADRAAPATTRRAVTPRARRLAADLGISLDAIDGTGPGGRVIEDDVRRVAAAAEPADDAQAIPLTGMRGTIARRMHDSLATMAQLTLTTTADVTELVRRRERLATEPPPTYTDLVIAAVARALRQHPRLNATVDGDRIRLIPDIHIGVATAVDDGLMVPVIRHADRKSPVTIAEERRRLVARVRAGDVGADDVSGSTFTVTNLGGYGIESFTPIINPPEVAILGIGRIVDQAARDGAAVAWRKVVTLSLTIDHRVVDGAPGAAFLQTTVHHLEQPAALLADE